ncbi:amino acid permease, partial [candidate division KSB1 bacterium]|nr:amino acid permease [candidate division KSB1 bacterium]
GQPRIFFSMSRDGLLPPLFRKVHPRYRTPYVATIITGIFVASFAAFASIDEMVDLTNIGTLFAFMLVSIGIIVLRKKDPHRPRPFRVPGGWRWTIALYVLLAIFLHFMPMSNTAKIVTLVLTAGIFIVSRNFIFPVLGVLSCLYLIYYLPPTSWLRFASWLNIGFIIYAVYGTLHSKLNDSGEGVRSAEQWAFSARIGGWLAVLGTFLLFLMRGLDIGMGAYKEAAHLTGWAHFQTILSAMAHKEAWMAFSWFKVIPMALNALFLCPVTIRRALRARPQMLHKTRLDLAIGLAVLVMVWSLFYFVMLVV